MEVLETEEVYWGDPIEMEIFGDWVGILFAHFPPYQGNSGWDSTLMLWDYVHGNVLGVR